MSEIPNPPVDASESDRADTVQSRPLGRTQKVINIALWSVLGVVIVGMVASKYLPRHPSMKVLFHTPAFALTDQNGKRFSDADLRGTPYVCDFIFTTCGSACPMMSQKLAGVQKQTPPVVQLVSFTVNPEHDTPAVLKEYGKEYGADPARWHFLTGTPKEMSDAVRGMNLTVIPATSDAPIGHSEKFLLVDADGNVRGIYDSTDLKSMQDLISDASWLANTPEGRGW